MGSCSVPGGPGPLVQKLDTLLDKDVEIVMENSCLLPLSEALAYFFYLVCCFMCQIMKDTSIAIHTCFHVYYCVPKRNIFNVNFNLPTKVKSL